MVESTCVRNGWIRSPWRLALWGTALGLLVLPWVAMQVTAEVAWSLGDFVLFGAMLAVACGAFELAARMTGSRMYRAAVGVAAGTAFLLVWLNLAVGLIGSEDNPANRMYAGVILVGMGGALLVRFRASGMVWVLVATAAAQGLVMGVSWALGLGHAFVLTGGFMALWLTSAALFHRAAGCRAVKTA